MAAVRCEGTARRRGQCGGAVPWMLLFTVILGSCLLAEAAPQDDPRSEFHRHEVVQPRIFTRSGRRKRDITPDEEHEDQLTLEIPVSGETFVIQLRMNKGLLAESYFEKYHGPHESVNRTTSDAPSYVVVNESGAGRRNHCHYQGKVNGYLDSWAALSTCRGISGVFSDGNETFYIHPPESGHVNSSHLVFKGSDMKPRNFTCGYSSKPHSLLAPLAWKKLQRLKRSIIDKEPYKSNPKTRYVELLLVNDHKEFEKMNKDRSAVFERSKQIANIVNGLYAPLNIYIALVGVLVWSEFDEITLSSDGDATLTNFLHYRRERLAPSHPNDNAQLVTGMAFDGGVVGKALKGPICTFEYSGGVNTDQSQVVGLVATTVAHELGHNFGMEHDNDKCQCPDEKCIMAPSSSSLSPRHWSSCSYEHLREAYQQGMDYCLRNRPRKLFDGPVCGNGFLEEGEECDCGLPQFCDSQCCNASTCQLMPNASCATGNCCDMDTCQVKAANEVCRNAVTECDLPEMCDGQSEFCPEDVYAQNGLDCGNGRAYCYEGQCRSHGDQCRLLWGETGRMSDPQCYNQNQNGNINGNCGFNRLNQTYKACEKEDVLCGMLYCAHLNERLEFGMESAALLPKSFMHIKGKVHPCRSAIIDLGLDTVDPGLVPNGAKCGKDSICVNQKCVPVASVRTPECPYDCYGNGVCNNKGTCFCLKGFAPPYCDYLLPGSGYHITVAMYIIFLCILPLAAITVFMAYYFHENIKTWWLAQARKAVIKSGAKQAAERKLRPASKFNFDRNSLRTIEISAPIPAPSTVEAASMMTHPVPDKQTTKTTVPTVAASVTTDASTGKLVPTRAAPPPPRVRPQRTPSWAPTSGVRPGVATVTRTSSLRTAANGRPLSITSARPTCPPPPRPSEKPQETLPQQEAAGSRDGGDGAILDFSNTKLAFVHEGEAKPSRANKPLPPIPGSAAEEPKKPFSSFLGSSDAGSPGQQRVKAIAETLLSKNPGAFGSSPAPPSVNSATPAAKLSTFSGPKPSPNESGSSGANSRTNKPKNAPASRKPVAPAVSRASSSASAASSTKVNPSVTRAPSLPATANKTTNVAKPKVAAGSNPAAAVGRSSSTRTQVASGAAAAKKKPVGRGAGVTRTASATGGNLVSSMTQKFEQKAQNGAKKS